MPPAEEQFDTFDEDGQSTGRKRRSQVHRYGYWHRSAQLFLYTPTGELLVHQRATDKDLYAGLWDHSIGEHLQPGETYLAGALRGAHEELGLSSLTLRALGEVRRQAFKDPSGEWWDRELQQSYIAIYNPNKHGKVLPDSAEVAQVDQWNPTTLSHWLAHKTAQLTPWFRQDLELHQLLPKVPLS
jgi:isopentenyldiphosphate isomerase